MITKENAKKLKTIKSLIEENVSDIIVAYSFSNEAIVVLEPRSIDGKEIYQMYRADEIMAIAAVFHASYCVCFGPPPTDYEGSVNDMLYVLIHF